MGHCLASHGYIVAAIDHHGNTCAEAKPDPRGYLLWWERAQDLRIALDRVLADPLFGAHIDSGIWVWGNHPAAPDGVRQLRLSRSGFALL